jgi:integrase
VGCIYKRGRIYWVKYSRTGRAYYESSGSKKHEDARRLLRLREGDIEKGLPVTPRVGRMRFQEAASDLEREYMVNERRSLADLQRRIRLHLVPFFGKCRMAHVTTADVRRYTDERLTAGAAPAQINRELSAFKRMFSLALKDGKLLYRPHIPMLQEHNVRTGFLEHAEYEAVLAELPEPIRPVVTFAYLTGWRIRSEILQLEWRQVDFSAGVVRLEVGTTKNDEGREFPFDVYPDLGDVLSQQRSVTRQVEQRRGQIVPWVFHRNGRPIRSFYGAWRTACDEAGCAGRIPHDFRRTAVRNLVRAGVPERVAMMLTGHKTRSVFDRYNIVNGADLREGVKKLAAASLVTKTVTIGRSGQVHRMHKRRK